MNAIDETEPTAPPAADTLEAWAWDYLRAAELRAKFALAPPPRALESRAPARRAVRPARPAPLVLTARAPKTPRGPDALRAAAHRARLAHTFLHHEVQAAELMCWAILAFPDAPAAFRAGLAAIARDEARHAALYRDYLATLGHAYGDFPVRDWFWLRVPAAATPSHFVATLGMGLEGANLDHTARFAQRLREAGDEPFAALQDTIQREEVPHVRFALHWFRAFTGEPEERFSAWTSHLVPPLSPLVMRGAPVEREARARAGYAARFLDELVAWTPDAPPNAPTNAP